MTPRAPLVELHTTGPDALLRGPHIIRACRATAPLRIGITSRSPTELMNRAPVPKSPIAGMADVG